MKDTNHLEESQKLCNECGRTLPVSSFTKDKYRKDGLNIRCKDCNARRAKDYKLRNPSYRKEYHERNKEHEHARNAVYYKTVFKKRQREIYRERYYSDIQYGLAMTLRGRLRTVMRKLCTKKTAPAFELLDCSIEALHQWLSYQFELGMSWDNYGEWHIDHVRPCASFDLSDPEQQKQCFHWTNLQPLWAEDNLRKGAKYG